MIKQSHLEMFKILANMQVEYVTGGIIFIVVERETITWVLQSKSIDMEIFKIGSKINPIGGAATAIEEKREVVVKLPDSVYGKRLVVCSAPVFDEDGKNIIGAVSVAYPKLHAVVGAFPLFAPVLADVFPEGVFIYVSNREKILCHQASKLFDIPDRHAGYILTENEIAYKVMKEGTTISTELGAEKYGVPTLITTSPVFDEENNNEIIGTFGIVIPKGTSHDLRNISSNLNEGINLILESIQKLAASANEIYNNDQILCKGISEIRTDSEKINKVSNFIKDVADDIDMLGLNASIQSASAGEYGKSFSVVAQEIRSLSENAKSTVPVIEELTESINAKAKKIDEYGGKSINSSKEQVAATQEIVQRIEEIIKLSNVLNEVANKT